MAGTRENEEVEAFISANERFRHTEGSGVVDVVIDIACGEKEMTLQIRGKVRVRLDVVLKGHITFIINNFLDAVVLFRPVEVVNIVIVVAGRRNGDFEKVRVDKHRCGGHKATTRVSIDTNAVDIDPGVAIGKLLNASLLVSEPVVAQIPVAIIVVPLRASRVTTTVADRDNNHA